MPKTRENRLHLWNYKTGKAICGREVDRSGPLVTSDTAEATCQVCRTEVLRWTMQVGTVADAAGSDVFTQLIADVIH